MHINDNKKTLIVILGPTGIGKTALSIELAKHYRTEILSSDSRQFYRELKIGTAAPTPKELSQVKHHFIGNISIHDYYNVSMFENQAIDVLNNIYKTKDTAIMVGGSGMYIDAVCGGIDNMPDIDSEIRNSLIEKYKTEGIETLRMELKRLDPEHYKKVDLKNYKRILRALEVCYQTGKPYSSFHKNTKKQRDFNIKKIGLFMKREELYERINLRVDLMIKDGLIDEAKKYFPYRELNALNTVGYKELFEYFDKKITLDEAIRLIKRNTRHYAKRQISWFNRYDDINWVEKDKIDDINSKI